MMIVSFSKWIIFSFLLPSNYLTICNMTSSVKPLSFKLYCFSIYIILYLYIYLGGGGGSNLALGPIN